MGTTLVALQDLLRAHRLQAEAPPLRGEDRRLLPLPTGIPAIDALLGGGFPRGQVSEAYGPVSSGRTGLAFGLLARITCGGALAAWVDPGDRLDPNSAAAAGLDLTRLLWLRGQPHAARALPEALAAVGTLLGSGLFEVVVLDLAGLPPSEARRLPGTTWIRVQRTVEGTPTGFLLLADAHTARGPGGVSLRLEPTGPRWSGLPGPGRLLRGLGTEVQAGPRAGRGTALLLAFS